MDEEGKQGKLECFFLWYKTNPKFNYHWVLAKLPLFKGVFLVRDS